MNKTQIRAYAQIIHSASMNRHAALQAELAVGFAVLLDSYPSKRLARAQLQKIYNDAGCKCADPSDTNWKGVNRRISASIKLFDFVTYEDVKAWAGDLQKAALVEAISKKLEQYKLNTVNEVLVVCQDANPKTVSTRGKVLGRKPGQKVETAHLKFSIPATATPDELLEAAGKLMTMAQAMVNAREAAREAEAAEHAASAEGMQVPEKLAA
jgi:hypothetical protein